MATRATTTSNTRTTTAEADLVGGWIPRRGPPPIDLRLWAALAVPLFYLFEAALLSGANRAPSAFLLSALNAVLLMAWLGFSPKAREVLAEGAVLTWPAIFFVAALAVGIWSLTPWTPGGPLPVWAWVDQSGAATLDRSATVTELVKLCGLACLFLVGYLQGGRPLTSRATLRAVLVVGSLYAFIALFAFLADGRYSWQVRRLTGGFLSANTTGTLFGMLAILAFSWVIQGIRRGDKDLARTNAVERLGAIAPRIAVLILLTGCLLLTASRAAIAITAAVMVACLAWEVLAGGLKAKSGMALVSTWGIYLLVLAAGAGAVAMGRFDKLMTDVGERGAMFSAHWDMFTVSPLFGWGLGAFDQINQQIMTPASDGYLWRIRATHNVVLQWLEEAGLVGALPMFACISLVIGLTWAGLKNRRESASWIRALLLADVVVLAHGMSDFALQVPMVAAFWAFLLGLQLSMAHALRRRDSFQ